MLTGRRALPGTDQPLAGLADLAARDVAALREVIEAGLDPDPERRPVHATDFAAGFANALLEGGVASLGGERATGPRSRKPRVRAPKLPGLDDPLTPAGPAVTDTPEPSPAPVRELRYEPVDEVPGDAMAVMQVERPAEPAAEPPIEQPSEVPVGVAFRAACGAAFRASRESGRRGPCADRAA